MKLNKLLLGLLLITGSQIFAAHGDDDYTPMEFFEEEQVDLDSEVAKLFGYDKTKSFLPPTHRGEIPSWEQLVERKRTTSRGAESAVGKQFAIRNEKRGRRRDEEESGRPQTAIGFSQRPTKARRISSKSPQSEVQRPRRTPSAFGLNRARPVFRPSRASSGYHSAPRDQSEHRPPSAYQPIFRETPQPGHQTPILPFAIDPKGLMRVEEEKEEREFTGYEDSEMKE